MTAAIIGIGCALPPAALAQDEAMRLAEQCCTGTPEEVDRMRRLFHRSGVQTRRFVVAGQTPEPQTGARAGGGSTRAPESVVPFFPPPLHEGDFGPTTARRLALFDECAGVLAQRAATEAMRRARRGPDTITHLITVSCTGMRAPGVDIALIESLSLPRDVRRAHVGFMGCHAAINALRLADDACRADSGAVVLIVCVELCSVHFQYGGQGDTLLANSLFGDGAAAAVVSHHDAASPGDAELLDFACFVLPDSRHCMTWTVGDHGFVMGLSPEVPDRIRASLASWIEPWLSRNHLSIGGVGSWAAHPGGPRILDALAQALDLERAALDVSRTVLSRCGNMSSPTILFILDELLRHRAPRPIAAIAFGPGLTIEAALVGERSALGRRGIGAALPSAAPPGRGQT